MFNESCDICNTTVTLPKPTVARRSVSQKWENRATSADCRPTSAPILPDFLIGRRLFCRSTQVKSFVDRSTDFQGFCHRWSVGRWSPDHRPTIGRHFEVFSSWYRPMVARSSGVYRPTIARRSVDDILSKNRRLTDAGYRPSFGRWSPDCRPIVNFGLYMCFIVYNACIHINYKIRNVYHAFILFLDSFHLTSCTSNIWFCVGFPIELFVLHFEINISTTSKRFHLIVNIL